MKRFIYLYIVIYVFLGGVFPANAQDDWMGWDFQYEGICYTKVGNSILQEVEVSLQNDGPFVHSQVNYPSLDSVNIPSVVYDGRGIAHNVVGIGRCAFLECYSLKKISLPPTVRYISGWAFMGCVNLEYIEIPAQLQWIGPYVFVDCLSLVRPQIPSTTLLDEQALIWAPFSSK